MVLARLTVCPVCSAVNGYGRRWRQYQRVVGVVGCAAGASGPPCRTNLQNGPKETQRVDVGCRNVESRWSKPTTRHNQAVTCITTSRGSSSNDREFYIPLLTTNRVRVCKSARIYVSCLNFLRGASCPATLYITLTRNTGPFKRSINHELSHFAGQTLLLSRLSWPKTYTAKEPASGLKTRTTPGYQQRSSPSQRAAMTVSSSSLLTSEARSASSVLSPPCLLSLAFLQEITINTTAQEIKEAKEGLPPLRNPPLLETADDLATLSHLNEPSGTVKF